MKNKYFFQIAMCVLVCMLYGILIYFKIGFDKTLMTLTILPGISLSIAIGLYLSKNKFYWISTLLFLILFIFSSYFILKPLF